MSPAQVNNSARQNMADMRAQWNDASWFQYGNGSKTVAHTYASSTSTTIATNVTTYYHAGRRIKAVGSSTGTIYGKVASSSYSAPNTTINYTWDSGSLSNEALTIYASAIQATGSPIHPTCLSDRTGTGNVVLSGSPTFTGTANFATIAGSATITAGANSYFYVASSTGNTQIEGHQATVTSGGILCVYNGRGLTNNDYIDIVASSGGVRLSAGGGSWAAISDYRAKNVAGLFTDSGAILDAVPVHLAALKTNPGEVKPMFLAHELQAVVPHAVHGKKDALKDDGSPQFQFADTTDPLTPVMWAELRALRARVGALEDAP